MTAECRELELALSLRAAGALDAAEGARVDAHLAECPACRAEAARTAEVLDLARLPPPTPAEHRALSDLSVRVAAGLKPRVSTLREPASLRAGRRLAAGILVAAGIAAIAIAPVVVRRQHPPAARPVAGETASAPATAPAGEATEQDAAWQEPDLDTLWQDTAVVALDTSDGG